MNDRKFDSGEPAPYRQWTPREYIPIAVFDAMSHEQRREIVNVAPLVAALANMARESAEKTERAS